MKSIYGRGIGLVLWMFGASCAWAQGLDLVDIPGGTAKLGDAKGDKNEIVRQVEIAPFKLMRREVSNLEFAEFVANTDYRTSAEVSGEGNVWDERWAPVNGATWRHPQGPKSQVHGMGLHPVVQVSAVDAEAFCQHHGLRLPTEDEWEYAARGPSGQRYSWGNTLTKTSLAKVANAGAWSCCAPSDADGYLRTAPVGSFPAGRSPFGLDDMIGNVWEWTSSPFPGDEKMRAIRGGGWGNNPYCLRAAYRHGNPPDIGLDMVGFRCAGDAD